MTQSNGTETNNDDVVSPVWGTWEELLLAFAVKRHGTGAWELIADELRKRCFPLTAHDCELKYSEIRRKYVPAPENGDPDGDRSNGEDSVWLLEELRRLRVAELRREVERYDLNIVTLETKVKKMEEEKKTESDLEKEEKKTEPGSEKDQVSVNESNSTDLGVEKVGTGENEKEPGLEVGEPAELVTEPGLKKEESCNGSSNSMEKKELVESEAESKEEAVRKDNNNSDVLSSASRSIEEEGGKDKAQRDENENEDHQSGVKEELSVESQKMMEVLMAIRARKFGFERRLKSQETSKYQNMILEHLDFETIETRLKQGFYKDSQTKFYRDVLLLVNNALVFFDKNSSEAKAALEVRQLISKEMPQKSTKSDSSSGKQASLQSLSKPRKDEPLLKPPPIPGPIKACRRRSSISAKASISVDNNNILLSLPVPVTRRGKDAAKSQNSSNSDEPTRSGRRRGARRISPVPDKNSSNSDEPTRSGRRRGARRISPVPDKRSGTRTQTRNRSSAETGKQVVRGGSSSHAEVKKNQPVADSKKRGASNFLNRLNKSPSSNNGSLAEEAKNMPLTSESSRRSSEKRETTSRRKTETRQSKEPEKKLGRPPKRGSAAPPPPPPALGKRGRDRDEAVESGGSRQPRKRSRKQS